MAGKMILLLCTVVYLAESATMKAEKADRKADVHVNPHLGEYHIDYHNKYSYNPSGDIYTTTPCDWTPWINAAHPQFTDGDHELYAVEGNPCGNKKPIEVQCRDAGSLKPWYLTHDILDRRCVVGVGIECINSKQRTGKCHDYEVRHKCAYVPGPMPWTEQKSSPVYWGNEPMGVKIDPNNNVEAIDTIPKQAQANQGRPGYGPCGK